MCWHTSLLVKNCIFVARIGQSYNPLVFLDEITKNASCIVFEEGYSIDTSIYPEVCFIVVNDIEKISHRLSDVFFTDLDNLKIVGVTGTNGKTTVSKLLKHIFDVARFESASIGTIDYEWGSSKIKIFYDNPGYV